jgi:hypothetical protein
VRLDAAYDATFERIELLVALPRVRMHDPSVLREVFALAKTAASDLRSKRFNWSAETDYVPGIVSVLIRPGFAPEWRRLHPWNNRALSPWRELEPSSLNLDMTPAQRERLYGLTGIRLARPRLVPARKIGLPKNGLARKLTPAEIERAKKDPLSGIMAAMQAAITWKERVRSDTEARAAADAGTPEPTVDELEAAIQIISPAEAPTGALTVTSDVEAVHREFGELLDRVPA